MVYGSHKRGNTERAVKSYIDFVWCLAFCAFVILAPTTSSARALVNEGSGTLMPIVERKSINKQVAIDIAEYYFPQNVWFHSLERCSWPAEPDHPGIAVYRVRKHPEDASMLSITYAILYKNDCGGILGIDSHPGDVEGFSCTLEPDESCPMGWRLFSVKTTAHGGAKHFLHLQKL